MSDIRVTETREFATMPMALLRDEHLSYSARGMYASMVAMAAGRDTYTGGLHGLKAAFGASEHAVRRDLAMLEDHGYITPVKRRADDGSILGTGWKFTAGL